MSVKRSRKFGFVVPRFGEEIGGGAETLVKELARNLSLRGDNIEIMTTCARDNRTWANELASGLTEECGLPVRRFTVDERNTDVWIPLQLRIHEGLFPGVEKQLDWMQHSVNSTPLYAYLYDNVNSFDALFFAPYLFGTTFWGALIGGEKSFLIPCLHDENYAYLEIFKVLFSRVRGVLFNSLPEKELAERLYGPVQGDEVGMGFEPGETDVSPGPYFKENFPYILYLGRKETGKSVQVLIDYFIEAKDAGLLPSDLALVLAGGGSFSDLERPGVERRDDVIDLVYLSEEEKRRLISHALFLCQPSRNESFSIVLMEAWLLSKPVVVNAACEVTRHHVRNSGGGLYFADSRDFALVCREFLQDDSLGPRLGNAGRTFVKDRYNWDAVIDRFNMVVDPILFGEQELEKAL